MGRGLLILVAGLVIIVGIVQKSISERLQFLPERSADYHYEMTAKNIASSVMEYGISEIRNNQSWSQDFPVSDFMGAEVSLEVFNFNDFNNNNPNIPSDHNIQNWNQFTLLVVSTAETETARAVVEASLTQNSFSRFAFFSNNENGVFFQNNDVINGPVHTNGTLNISGSPTFNGRVTSPNPWNGTGNPQFNGGSNFAANTINLPTNAQADQLRTQAQNGGLSFNNDITVNFNNNGTVDISDGGNPEVNFDLSNWNGVISSSGTVSVQGSVNGQVTVHSSQEVRIAGDVTYQNPSGDDLLGIVSQGNITVDPGAHAINGTQDLSIHASMMAIGNGNSFQLQGWDDGTTRGTLNLLGGIQQDTRGAVGSFNPNTGNITSGYSKNYTFDQRLSQVNPPFYPRQSVFTTQYVKDKPVEFL